MKIEVCVIIPVYNEAEHIGCLVRALKELGFDVIVVNDGSTDGSAEIAKGEDAIVLNNTGSRNGKGFTLKKGFSWVLEKDYDGVLVMDGDGQHAVGDVNAFLQLAETKGACVIVGNRTHTRGNMPFIRFITNRVMSGLISFACRQHISDTQCGYRYISAEVLRSLQLKTDSYEVETEVLMRSAKSDFPIYSVPIQTIYGQEKSYINPVKDTWNFLKYFLWEIFQRK